MGADKSSLLRQLEERFSVLISRCAHLVAPDNFPPSPPKSSVFQANYLSQIVIVWYLLVCRQICGTRYLKYQSIYNTGSIPVKKQLFPEKNSTGPTDLFNFPLIFSCIIPRYSDIIENGCNRSAICQSVDLSIAHF